MKVLGITWLCSSKYNCMERMDKGQIHLIYSCGHLKLYEMGFLFHEAGNSYLYLPYAAGSYIH